MKKEIIDKELINKITHRVPIREKAFFTIMRQSGLKPQIIKRLRIKNLEPDTIIPRRIETRQESKQTTDKEFLHFIGEEANNYITQYLATRRILTPESLLFTTRNKVDKEISTKNVSRAFRETLEKIESEKKTKYEVKSANTEKSGKRNFSLLSLTEFYRENTKHYRTELSNNPNESDEYYRKLYKEKAVPFLEIESPIIIRINPTTKRYRDEIEIRDNQIKEITQILVKDNEYIGSILSLLYNNSGDPETGENITLGDDFIELWKGTSAEQRSNLNDAWNRKTELLPYEDIVESLTKELKRILKPYEDLKTRTMEPNKRELQGETKGNQ